MQWQASDYRELEQALQAVGAAIGAAECHGMLCGMLSARQEVSAAAWIAQVLEGTEPQGDEARRCLELLSRAYQGTRLGLDDANLGFRLLLPPDEVALPESASALAAWVDGYLYGLGAMAAGDDLAKTPDVREALSALGEIARLDDRAAQESDREAFEELAEFVRVVVLLVREQINPAPRQAPVPESGPAKGH